MKIEIFTDDLAQSIWIIVSVKPYIIYHIFIFQARWVRSTTIFLSTEHGEYGVRRVPYFKSTKISTEYGDFSEYGVREVRSTKSTILQGYKNWHGVRLFFWVRGTRSTEYQEHRTPRVRKLARGTTTFLSTGYEEYGVPRVRKCVLASLVWTLGHKLYPWLSRTARFSVRGSLAGCVCEQMKLNIAYVTFFIIALTVSILFTALICRICSAPFILT